MLADKTLLAPARERERDRGDRDFLRQAQQLAEKDGERSLAGLGCTPSWTVFLLLLLALRRIFSHLQSLFFSLHKRYGYSSRHNYGTHALTVSIPNELFRQRERKETKTK